MLFCKTTYLLIIAEILILRNPNWNSTEIHAQTWSRKSTDRSLFVRKTKHEALIRFQR